MHSAANWQSGGDFLTNTKVALHWSHWFGTNAASKITLKEDKPHQLQHQKRSSSLQPSRHDKKGYGRQDRGSSTPRKSTQE